ncbi:MAG: hypothetical protein WCK98_01910 [bacterium]
MKTTNKLSDYTFILAILGCIFYPLFYPIIIKVTPYLADYFYVYYWILALFIISIILSIKSSLNKVLKIVILVLSGIVFSLFIVFQAGLGSALSETYFRDGSKCNDFPIFHKTFWTNGSEYFTIKNNQFVKIGTGVSPYYISLSDGLDQNLKDKTNSCSTYKVYQSQKELDKEQGLGS